MIVTTFSELKKAGGPYYGPRGGKWADSGHTISWKEPKDKTKLLSVSRMRAKQKKSDRQEQARVSRRLNPTPKDVEAVNAWFTLPEAGADRFRRIKRIRNESAKPKPSGVAGQLLSLIDKAEQLERRPVVLYRGLKIPHKDVSKLVLAKTFNDKAMSSWTTDPDDALTHSYIGSLDDREGTSVILRMTTKKGAPISAVLPLFMGPPPKGFKMAQDTETLLKGMKTKVTTVTKWFPYDPGLGEEPSILMDLEHL